MRVWWFSLLLVLSTGDLLSAQAQVSSDAQTPRQALIEMFLSDDPDAFARHLPEAVRKAVPDNGGEPIAATILRTASAGRGFLRGGHIQTFDDGPIIVVTSQGPDDKIEIAVEHDIHSDDSDEIEVSAHIYHEGEEQFLTVIPRLTFSLKQEKGIWRLADFTMAARVPLSDPNYHHGLKKQQQESNESAALMRLNFIATAETQYVQRHSDKGYVCNLTTLFAPEPAEDDSSDSDDASAPPQGNYDPGAANPEWNGYRFALSGCVGSPASQYQVSVVPVDADSEAKSFCSDESETVKSVAGTKIADCLGEGTVVRSRPDPMPVPVTE